MGNRQEPKKEIERAMLSICWALHGLIGKFPNTRIYIAQPSPRMEELFKQNTKLAMVRVNTVILYKI